MEKISKLRDMAEAGLMNISYDEEESKEKAVLMNTEIDLSTARSICSDLGWTRMYLSPFEIISKTGKFIKGLKNNIADEYFWDKGKIEWENYRISNSMSSYDRIHLCVEKRFDLTITFHMPHSGGTYTVYDRDSVSVMPVNQSANMRSLCRFIKQRLDGEQA